MHRKLSTLLAGAAISFVCATPSHALLTIIEEQEDAQQCDTLAMPELINSFGLDSLNLLQPLDSSGSIVVPEPSGTLLLLLGMVPMFLRRRR